MLRTVLTLAILVVGVALGAERCPQWSEPYLHDICNRLVGTLIGSTDILYLVVKNEAAKLEVYQGYIDDSGILLIDNGKKKLLREILPKIYENNDNRFQEGDVTHVMSLFVDATWSILMKRTTKYAFWKVQNNNWQFHQVEQNEHNQAYSPSISKSANSDGTWFVVGEGGLFNLSAKHIRENFEVAQNAFPWMLTEDATRDRLFMHDYELSAHDEKGPTWKIPSEAYGFVSGTKATLIWPGHVTRQGVVAEVLQFELGGNSLTPRYQTKRWFAFRNITLDKFIQIYSPPQTKAEATSSVIAPEKATTAPLELVDFLLRGHISLFHIKVPVYLFIIFGLAVGVMTLAVGYYCCRRPPRSGDNSITRKLHGRVVVARVARPYRQDTVATSMPSDSGSFNPNEPVVMMHGRRNYRKLR